MNPFANVSCIILSAGSSDRMGGHKALLKFDKTFTYVEKITNEYLTAGIGKVIVVVSRELNNEIKDWEISFPAEIHIVINPKTESGRFYSLQTGIQHLQEGNYCFFQNIDNPFITVKLLQDLIALKDKADVIIPAFGQKSGHPVLFSPRVAQEIREAVNPDLRINEFLQVFPRYMVETTDSNILININSPEDYANAGFIF
jgi:CTP:molybdopterin cytidylyltransferase MocA